MIDVCQKHDAKLLTYGTLVRPNSFYTFPSSDSARNAPILDVAFFFLAISAGRWAFSPPVVFGVGRGFLMLNLTLV